MNIEFVYMDGLNDFMQILVLGFVLSLPVCYTVESLKSTGIAKAWFYTLASIVISGVLGYGYAFAFTNMTPYEALWLSVCLWWGSQGLYDYLKDSNGFIGKSFVSLAEKFFPFDFAGLSKNEDEKAIEKDKTEVDEVVEELEEILGAEVKEEAPAGKVEELEDVEVDVAPEEKVETKEEAKPEEPVKVQAEMPLAEKRNILVKQIKVLVSDLRVRTEPSTKGEILGYAMKSAFYSFSDMQIVDGINWYHVGTAYIGDAGDGDIEVYAEGEEEKVQEKFRFPVNYVGMSVPFSSSHLGIDLGWSSSNGGSTQAIVSAFKGKVSKADFFDGGAGNMVEVYFDDDVNDCRWYARYKHLSKISVKVGDIVEAGDKLGNMGSTGDSDGNHLHFDLIKCPKGHTYSQTTEQRKKYSVDPLKHLYLHEGQKVGSETDKKYKILRA